MDCSVASDDCHDDDVTPPITLDGDDDPQHSPAAPNEWPEDVMTKMQMMMMVIVRMATMILNPPRRPQTNGPKTA